LGVSLVALAHGVIPPTLNYETPDPACPVNVVSEPRIAENRTFVALNHNTTGQATAVVIRGL
jgi:3-oxoacyl-[acyl-carrier-protein] synthase II